MIAKIAIFVLLAGCVVVWLIKRKKRVGLGHIVDAMQLGGDLAPLAYHPTNTAQSKVLKNAKLTVRHSYTIKDEHVLDEICASFFGRNDYIVLGYRDNVLVSFEINGEQQIAHSAMTEQQRTARYILDTVRKILNLD